ncbi:MAG: hypothetical protein CBC48_18895, partial [bacterium TMED88]
MRCPTIDWYIENTDVASYVTKPRFINNDQITEVRTQCLSSSLTAIEQAECQEEARLLALNTFSSDPEEYTCDAHIPFIQSQRDKRPFYDSLSILQLGAGMTEQLMYTWNDIECKHIISNPSNDNNVALDKQPHPIKLIQCATCTCIENPNSGFWAGTLCDNCGYGFFGESCSNACPGVCGSVSIGAETLFYEEYQKQIGSTIPCENPASVKDSFLYTCPATSDLETILRSNAFVWKDYDRAIFCNDGKDSPGSCLRCPNPLIGNLDVRLENPEASCYRLTCTSNLNFLQTIARLEDEYSIGLDLSIWYSDFNFKLPGKPNAYFNDKNSVLNRYKSVDLFQDCGAGMMPIGDVCCTSYSVTYSVLNFLTQVFDGHINPTLQIQECAERAMSTDDFIMLIGDNNFNFGPTYQLTKGIFSHKGDWDCYIYYRLGSLDMVLYDSIDSVSLKQQMILNQDTLSGTSAQGYRATLTCNDEVPNRRTLAYMDDTETDNTELFTLSQNYELGCAYNIDYPLNREESTDDVVDGALRASYDPYGNSSIIDLIDIINRDRCITRFFEACQTGHLDNMQNPFLTYYAFQKVEEYLDSVFTDATGSTGRCDMTRFRGKMWCPQCPRCTYETYTPGNIQSSNCEYAYFPYCLNKQDASCLTDAWRQDENCNVPSIQPDYNVHIVQRNFDADLSLIGQYTTKDCAKMADRYNSKGTYFGYDVCNDEECNCYIYTEIRDESSLTERLGFIIYKLDWTNSNNGINVFEAYISEFALDSVANSYSLKGWYVERMRQAIPDKYKGWKVFVNETRLVTEYQQWLECLCPDHTDWCEDFSVQRCVSYDPVQNEWSLLFYSKGSKVPTRLPEREMGISIHDEEGHGAVIRSSALLRSNIANVGADIPDTCDEEDIRTLDPLPSTKIYYRAGIECDIPDAEIACRNRLDCENDGPIDYEPMPLVDRNGIQVYHEVCKEKIEGQYTLKECAEKAIEKFFTQDSKGVFAVERPQIVDPSRYADAAFLNPDFDTSHNLSCYVYSSVNIDDFDSRTTSICNGFPHNPGCARAADLFASDDSNEMLYNNQCDEPVFIQTYYIPKLLSSGAYLGQLQPNYDGQIMCYDYGPCRAYAMEDPYDWCNCRPTRFTGTVPDIHYANFSNIALHNEAREAWLLTSRRFASSFGHWTEAHLPDAYLEDWLYNCYGDGKIDDVEAVKISNREKLGDEVTLYHLLVADLECPSFASEANAYAERTAGRFASGLWATGTQANLDGDYIQGSGHTKLQKIQVGEKYVEVIGGTPDLSVTSSECPTIYPHAPTDGRPSGCYKAGGAIYFNTLTTSSTECSSTAPCIQKRDNIGNYIYGYAVVILDYRTVDLTQFVFGDPMIATTTDIDAAIDIPYDTVIRPYCDDGEQRYKRYGPCLDLKSAKVDGKMFRKSKNLNDANYKIEEIPEPVILYEVNYGAPDLSVNLQECKRYAESQGQAWQASSREVTLNAEIKGCYILPDTDLIYFNKDFTSTASCSLALRACLQKEVPAYEQVTSGTPDLSVSEEECGEFGDANDMTLQVKNWTNYVSGCFVSGGNLYYTLATTSYSCTVGDTCIQKRHPYYIARSGAPNLSINEDDCEAYANSVGLTFSAHDDTHAGSNPDWQGRCYCSTKFGNLDGRGGANRYASWALSNSGTHTTDSCRNLCYSQQEAKAAQGCSRLPVSTVRSDILTSDVIVYIRNSYYDPPIQCNANNFAGVCIQKDIRLDMDTAVHGNLYVEEDSVIMIVKDAKYYEVHSMTAASTQDLPRSAFKIYVDTSSAGSSHAEPMYNAGSFPTCMPYKANQGINEDQRVGGVEPGFMHMRPQTKIISQIGPCKPTGGNAAYGALGECEAVNLQGQTDDGYAPGCTCPAGYSNVKYSDYNQPWSEHVSCNTIEGDITGSFIHYKPCFGPGSCSGYPATQHCCGFDTVSCDTRLKGRCVNDDGLPELNKEDGWCNKPFGGCVYGSVGLTPSTMQCKTPTDPESTFFGMTSTEVASDVTYSYRSQYEGTDPLEGVVYVNEKPQDALRSNYNFMTPGCHPCINGRMQDQAGQARCRLCGGGLYNIDFSNPWRVAPSVTVDAYTNVLPQNRWKDAAVPTFEYEWWKIAGYP